jgi:hypothetical protein
MATTQSEPERITSHILDDTSILLGKPCATCTETFVRGEPAVLAPADGGGGMAYVHAHCLSGASLIPAS